MILMEKSWKYITSLHWRSGMVEIHDSFSWFGAAADRLLIGMDESDVLVHEITKKGEVIIGHRKYPELMAYHDGTLDWAEKEVGVVKLCVCCVEKKCIKH